MKLKNSIARFFALTLAAFQGKDYDFTKGSLSKAIFFIGYSFGRNFLNDFERLLF